MSDWHIARNGQQEGPFTPQQIGAMLAKGELKASEALAWKEGMDDWKSLPESGVLAEASLAGTAAAGVPAPSAVTNPGPAVTQAVQPVQQAAVNPYAAPAAVGGLGVTHQNLLEYPGIGRLAYLGLQIGISIAAYAILFVVILGAASVESGGGMVVGLFLIMALAGVASIYIGVKRVQNLGMSGWAILWSLVPIMSIWISWRMFACPAGYDDHKQLDTPGKVLTGILIGLIALGVVANFIAIGTTASSGSY